MPSTRRQRRSPDDLPPPLSRAEASVTTLLALCSTMRRTQTLTIRAGDLGDMLRDVRTALKEMAAPEPWATALGSEADGDS